MIERQPVQRPVGHVGRVRIPVTGEPSPFRFSLIGLHPDQPIDQVRYLAAPSTVSFNDHQRTVSRNVDRSLSAVLEPSRRPVAECPALMDRHKNPVRKEISPAEAGVLPRDVVGVDDYRSWDSLGDAFRQRGLSAVAAPVYCQDNRTSSHDLAPSAPNYGVDDCA